MSPPDPPAPLPQALTIAGSDSSGGAGIQADLKTFQACGVYGLSVVAAVTAQNTRGVQAAMELPADFVGQQCDCVFGDLRIRAVKTGMLASAALVEIVGRKIDEYAVRTLVVDPVMVAKGGHALLHEEARQVLAETLLPRALVVTPNLHEAGLLAGLGEIADRSGMETAARRIKALGPAFVVVKGGHLQEDACDLLFDGKRVRAFSSPKLDTVCTHGAGCTFSAAITAELAKGASVEAAVATAKSFVTRAIAAGFPIGHGHAPLNHQVDLFD